MEPIVAAAMPSRRSMVSTTRGDLWIRYAQYENMSVIQSKHRLAYNNGLLTRHHSDLVVYRRNGPYEPSKLRADRAVSQPFD